jgi:uncharacterized protein (TIGR03085 family)
MSNPPPARAERDALCDLFLSVGPNAPTLCAGWTTIDLATHLIVREGNPLGTPGIFLPGPFAAHTARLMERAKTTHSFEELVAKIRSGPPLLWKPIDAIANLNEYFIHHEDVRRGGGDNTPRPEAEVADLEDAIWKLLRRGAKLMARKIGNVGLELVRDDGDSIPARQGEQTAVLTGRPGELSLYLMGRKAAANVDVTGPAAAVAAVQAAAFGV